MTEPPPSFPPSLPHSGRRWGWAQPAQRRSTGTPRGGRAKPHSPVGLAEGGGKLHVQLVAASDAKTTKTLH